MIKVGFFVDTFNLGGAETVVLQLAEQLLKEEGYEPLVIHFGSNIIAKKCKELGIQQHLAPGYKYYKKTVTLPLFSFMFYKFIRNTKIDVLHSHLFGAIVGSAPAAKMARITHVGTLHDIYTIEEKPARILLLKLASMLGTRLITVSKQMESYYRQRASFPENSLSTIYNGVNNQLSSHKGRDLIQKDHPLESNEIIITCVARLVQLKRHDILIKAFDEIKSDLKCRLLIVGGGPEGHKLESFSKKSHSSDRIHFLGERNDVLGILNNSDIFVLASDTEGLSCSILEAMAAGLPIIATNVGGNNELVESDLNGYLVKKSNVSQMAEKLKKLIDDELLRKKFGKQSLDIVKEKFRLSQTIINYKYLYRKRT